MPSGLSDALFFLLGLQRARDNLMSELRELAKKKPRGKVDKDLIGELTRLESAPLLWQRMIWSLPYQGCELREMGHPSMMRVLDSATKCGSDAEEQRPSVLILAEEDSLR